MSKEKFEHGHKNELDCEVTVFEGAHAICDPIEDEEDESVKKSSAPEYHPSPKEKAEENYDI